MIISIFFFYGITELAYPEGALLFHGSGIAVSNAQPEIISDSVKAAKSVNPKVQVICGAGIVKGEDVSESIKLGASGILVASGITKSNNKLDKLIELAKHL